MGRCPELDGVVRLDLKDYLVKPGSKVKLADRPTSSANGTKDDGQQQLEVNKAELDVLQERLFVAGENAVLLVLQGMDAAGKDGIVRHVIGGINPHGVDITSFKAPTPEERSHDFLWRVHKHLPAKGRLAVFNRSHYEDVLVVKVHPEYLGPGANPTKDFWESRYQQIVRFEEAAAAAGTIIVKCFLYVSKKEQRQRFLDRIDDPAKQWKLTPEDIAERQHWDAYIDAYDEAMTRTATSFAPWYVVPADKKWMARLAISEILLQTLRGLNLKSRRLSAADAARLAEARQAL